MKKVKEVIVVEGRYDKNALSQVVDATVVTLGGFSVFNDKEKLAFLRRLAEERGLIVLTDSDGAGFVIRNFISSIIPPDRITHVYIPDIFGKEKRKTAFSAEGKLGVEGVEEKILLEAFEKAGVTASPSNGKRRRITNLDLFEHGLSGRENSVQKRRLLLKRLELPERLSTSSLVKILNTFVTYEEFEKTVKELF